MEKTMSSENGQVQLLTGQLKQAVEIMRGTFEGATHDVAHEAPGGNSITIVANVAHAIATIDGVVHGLVKGEAPLMMSVETGLSSPPPQGFEWGDWGQTVEMDKNVFHEYAGKVMESATAYLGTLNDADLTRVITSPSGNEMSVAQWLSISILNTAWHTGEVAALKGIRGLKGYQF